VLARGKADPLDALKKTWAAGKAKGIRLSDIGATLVRLGKDCRGKLRVADCPMQEICPRLHYAA